MARTTYEISVSLDSPSFVTVRSDEPDAAKAAMDWAVGVLDALTAWDTAGASSDARDRASAPSSNEDGTGEAAIPQCAVHHVPMVRMQGKRGPFWSCHQRNQDGSFCSYRPETS